MCFSGRFSCTSEARGSVTRGGHERGAGRLQLFKTDNVSQLSNFIKRGLTINPLNTRAPLSFYFPGRLARVADGLIPSNFSLCGTRMSFHPVHFGSDGIPYVTTGLMYTALPEEPCCGGLSTSVGMFSTMNHPSLHMRDMLHRDGGFKM